MWRKLEAAATEKGGWKDVIGHHQRIFLLQGVDPRTDMETSDQMLRFLLVSRPELAEEAELERLEDVEIEPMRQLIYAELEALMPQPEDASLLRYEAHFDREFRASVNQLTRLTKTGDDLIDASDLLSSESEIPTITDVEPIAPNEAKPEAESAPAASETPNEPKPVTPVEPVWESDNDRIGRALDAYKARAAVDRPQVDSRNQ